MIPAADLIILPGSKSVRADLAWLRANGWDTAIRRHLRYGGRVLGVCGGYQMLGQEVFDPLGLEGAPGSSVGLRLLDITTTLAPEKQLRNVCGTLILDNAAVTGYERHAGVTTGAALTRAFIQLEHGSDGALSEDGQIIGTYLHGLFESSAACDALLHWAGLESPKTPDYHALREAGIERLADALETHLAIEQVLSLLNYGGRS